MPAHTLRGHRSWRRALAALVWALAFAWEGVTAAPVAAAPVVTVEPDRGPCDTRVTLRGAGFAPSQPLRLTVGTVPRSGRAFGLRPPAVGADGAFAQEADMASYAGPCRPGSGVPAGTRFIFYVVEVGTPSERGALLATATFTVTESPAAGPTPAPPMPGLPNTGSGSAAAGQPWPPAWGLGLALLLTALGGVFAARPWARRRG